MYSFKIASLYTSILDSLYDNIFKYFSFFFENILVQY